MALVIKKGDTRTAISAQLKNPSGNLVDLTGATVNFVMTKSSTVLINRVAEITDAVNGKLHFVFATGETNITGIVKAEFKVTYSDGTIETFPNSGYINITFEPGLI